MNKWKLSCFIVFLLICISCIAKDEVKDEVKEKTVKVEILYSTGSVEEIRAYWKDVWTHAIISEPLGIGKKKALVVLHDGCSGITCMTIHVYIFNNDRWNLLLMRRTRTHVKYEFDKAKNELRFLSVASGKLLLVQSLDTVLEINE